MDSPDRSTSGTAPADGLEDDDLTDATRNVIDALTRAGIEATARVLPTYTRTAAEAAAALSCDIGAIANSLVFMADDEPLLVMTSGAHRVDRKRLARRLGRGKIRQASAEQVLEATGQAVGGVSPVGHPTAIETIIDPQLEGHPVVWAAAGTPTAVFSTTYQDLIRATNGTVIEVD